MTGGLRHPGIQTVGPFGPEEITAGPFGPEETTVGPLGLRKLLSVRSGLREYRSATHVGCRSRAILGGNAIQLASFSALASHKHNRYPGNFMWIARILGLIAWLFPQTIAMVASEVDPLESGLEVMGMEVVPHQFSPNLRWRRAPDPELSARVTLFVRNPTDQPQSVRSIRWSGKAADALVREGDWSWRDPECSADFSMPPQSLRVLRWNGRSQAWGVGTEHPLEWQDARDRVESNPFTIEAPQTRIESVVFLNAQGAVYPTRMIATVRNDAAVPIRLVSCRLWLPESNDSFQTLYSQSLRTDLKPYPTSGIVQPNEMAGIELEYERLPLTYTAIEIHVEEVDTSIKKSVWTYLKIRPASFDISGGWIAGNARNGQALAQEEYWKTLALMSVNTGQIEEVGGYTDQPELYNRYPIKRFNRLGDRSRYDTDAMLPTIHAVEFLGEPQYGGGRPVPPQEVFDKLSPYQPWKLPTSITLSEERTWRYYSGLSDYPHYDAYRVIAPAADAWSGYDRWQGKSIRWGSPLETIGDMTRSLRAQSRPATIAYWSQGAHDGWGGVLSPRRGSPTPDELRSQAWHALGNGIASLYWFNLSVKSLAKYPDLIGPIANVGREIHLLKDVLEQGTAYEYRRIQNGEALAWDLSSIAVRDSALLVVNDLAYSIDESTRTFRFEPRAGEFSFRIPSWMQGPNTMFRIDADGVHDVEHEVRMEERSATIRDTVQVVGIYVLTSDPKFRSLLESRHRERLAYERGLGFDPVNNSDDLRRLRALVD